MAKAPKSEPLTTPPLSLEQFAALEAWCEAMSRLAGLTAKNGAAHAPLVTEVYQKRQRAMRLLTGATPPEAATAPVVDDDYSDIA